MSSTYQPTHYINAVIIDSDDTPAEQTGTYHPPYVPVAQLIDVPYYPTGPSAAPVASAYMIQNPVITKEPYFLPPPPPAYQTIETTNTTYPVGESPLHKKARRRRRRRLRMVAGGVGGFAVGAIALGPVGAILGCAGAISATRAISKRGERKKDDRMAHQKQTPPVIAGVLS